MVIEYSNEVMRAYFTRANIMEVQVLIFKQINKTYSLITTYQWLMTQ